MRRHCNYCEYSAMKGSTLSMHVSMKHSRNKKHHCPMCDQKFAEKTQLQHHFVNNHCDPDIPCGFPGCAFIFKNTTTQRMHYVRSHMKDKLVFSSSSMKGYKICLTCNVFLKRANMMYHLAQCSPDSPFCTNVAALEKKAFDKGLDELAGLSDDEEDFWGEGEVERRLVVEEVEAVGMEGEDEDLDDLLGRVLST